MIKFYGYKRCSTSKKAQKWLDEIKWMTKYQDRGLRYFFNTSGQHYRQQKLKDKIPDMTIEEAADMMSKDGKLIKRPLVVDDDHLTCGFRENIYEQTWL